ncbi:hypothetical protein SPRG_13701 [Saprolegnia parasitica CBS 223.65]|uniref:Uncharacterized protein n=1 Tax=Saprolegnia parasitica (strain CBS 223.65) TaxID=695850 RepID=A0A067BT01_SAPPC|nr:hypothetical protein SPRG_13701 [Saprolegnia parasitica CBS 223.65]KDO21388.1 hypothetical protein SPRG_13701 [Saprolegnia parasitica CBS 223.65]|eukprot:XP_012207943.1 hypothetical protein SPRG_13701 [Saprolegnia parasitica CBS 223.65]
MNKEDHPKDRDDLTLCECMQVVKPWRATSDDDVLTKWQQVAKIMTDYAAYPVKMTATACEARWEKLRTHSNDPSFGNDVSPELQAIVRDLVRQMETKRGPSNQPNAKLVLGGAAVAGAVAAPVATTAVVAGLGFTSGGIAAGSTAAGMMSAAAVANGGSVAAGSTVAVLQSVGAAGLGVAGGAAVAVAGAALAVPFAGAFLWYRNSRNNNDDDTDGSSK